ncbi:sugar dehydrogenase complex small subunit [Streptomyces exfoliatus]|uniref:sugar dehydrogenase complex small subunit n=1 Tax=Streptomyces exfoliatus TaxID=1905 RepID=UPI0004CB626E|nr:sugar dehydrogenase complex small subunit [Streptomyces exfoliatus]
MTHAADFRALSELLTGEQPLDQATADAHRERLARHFPADVDRLIDAYRAAVGQPDPGAALFTAVNADPALARLARETLAIWYTAQFTRPDNTQDAPDTPSRYRAGLVWKVISAHPLSAAPVPGGYGYWTQHP